MIKQNTRTSSALDDELQKQSTLSKSNNFQFDRLIMSKQRNSVYVANEVSLKSSHDKISDNNNENLMNEESLFSNRNEKELDN